MGLVVCQLCRRCQHPAPLTLSLPHPPLRCLPSPLPPPCRPGKRVAWQKAFEGVDAVPLGMCGSTVENLVYRLMAKGERLAVGPKVVVYWIG